jgi:prevent-host-death family protein
MSITATALRQNVYQILDEVIETGKPIEVVRKGAVVRLVPQKKVSKLSRLKRRNLYIGDPDEIIGMDWSKEWSELK